MLEQESCLLTARRFQSGQGDRHARNTFRCDCGARPCTEGSRPEANRKQTLFRQEAGHEEACPALPCPREVRGSGVKGFALEETPLRPAVALWQLGLGFVYCV